MLRLIIQTYQKGLALGRVIIQQLLAGAVVETGGLCDARKCAIS